MGKKTELSPPWAIYYKKLEALFGEDPDIKIEYDEDENVVNLYVHGQDKSDALSELLPLNVDFGNMTLGINVIPDNRDKTKIDLYKAAFSGNPVFSYARTIEGVFTNPISYFVFKNKVVQFYADNLGDIYGNMNTLYQDIADEIFDEHDSICFCTDLPDNAGGIGK